MMLFFCLAQYFSLHVNEEEELLFVRQSSGKLKQPAMYSSEGSKPKLFNRELGSSGAFHQGALSNHQAALSLCARPTANVALLIFHLYNLENEPPLLHVADPAADTYFVLPPFCQCDLLPDRSAI